MKWTAHTLFAVGATITVVVVVAVGLFLNGSPLEVRKQKLDERRVSDLQYLTSTITGYLHTQLKLPAAFSDLDRESLFYQYRDRDPVSRDPYEYRITGERSFELCATFDTYAVGALTDMREGFLTGPANVVEAGELPPRFWDHEPGRKCFSFTVPPATAPLR